MEALLKAWRTSRELHDRFFDQYTLDQLNTIPTGFNNNLIWNIGHIIVAQQSLVYKGSGLPGYLSDDMIATFKPGTRPTKPITQGEADAIRTLLQSLIGKTEEDLARGIFTTYEERTTGTGFHLGSLKDALHFNNYHEGIHLGYMMSIRKFV